MGRGGDAVRKRDLKPLVDAMLPTRMAVASRIAAAAKPLADGWEPSVDGTVVYGDADQEFGGGRFEDAKPWAYPAILAAGAESMKR